MTWMGDRSRSPSPSSSSSGSSSSSPQLDSSTLAILESFLSSKVDAEQRFTELSESLNNEDEDEDNVKPMMSVDEYRLAFGEDWQLSQFWYSTTFATQLAKSVHALCTEDTTVAFVCCPTAFVAFQHTNPLKGAKLLEVDRRFAVLAAKQYIPYDIDEPDVFPETLRGKVDIAIVDPPFLNEATNQKVAQTLRQILHANSRLILLTSTSVRDVLAKVYAEPPLGPLRSTSLSPEHGQLQNDFHCWGSWDGAEKVGLEDS